MAGSGRFALAEIGARWGTWGMRAAAAIREYNDQVTGLDLLLVDNEASACLAIEEVWSKKDARCCGNRKTRDAGKIESCGMLE